MKREFVEGIELTDLLDPFLFDNHKDVINSLFEVYFDISNLYLTELGDKNQRTINFDQLKNKSNPVVIKQKDMTAREHDAL